MLNRKRPPLRVVPEGRNEYIPASDAEIIEAFARGDRRATELVYDRLFAAVDSTLYRVVGRRESDHDDLVQSAFEQIVITLSRRSFAGGCTLHGWAAAIACHVGLNAIRSRRRARRIFDPDAEVEAHPEGAHRDVEAQVAARRELERMRAHLAEMDPDRAETVLVHDVFGASLAETAKLMGVSMTAAQSRLVRGRRDLRERMAREVSE
ncbi:MAG TPA: RNA polymerase sigma factor [Polyangiaceae bacterium]|nr:RNA polymerase sigma factor [Polyangiaceae bacterium]